MRHIIALLKFVLRLAACFGIGIILSLTFARILPPSTSMSLIKRISVALGMWFFIDLVQRRVGRHVNKTVDNVIESTGYKVQPHPLDKL